MTTPETERLMPCPNPWCDSHDIEAGGPRAPEDVWSIADTITERFRVQCAYCYMKGPGANDEAEAITAWNTRTPSPLPPDLEKDVPVIDDFREGVTDEMRHQVARWGTAHDRGKEPEDWFWLVGYLAGKALAAHKAGNTEKALHHTISTAAALGNWHAAIQGTTAMMPGIDPEKSDLVRHLEEREMLP